MAANFDIHGSGGPVPLPEESAAVGKSQSNTPPVSPAAGTSAPKAPAKSTSPEEAAAAAKAAVTDDIHGAGLHPIWRPKEDGAYMSIDREKANALLKLAWSKSAKGSPANYYLLRPGSEAGTLVVSFLKKEGNKFTIEHAKFNDENKLHGFIAKQLEGYQKCPTDH